MKDTYAVLGAGMQGTCAAYDLARFANASQLILADVSMAQAKKAADRVNRLTNSTIAVPYEVDVLDPESLGKLLSQVDVVISCVPYWMHPHVAKVALDSITDMVDLGGNTDITMQTLALDADAKEAGVTLVPDSGLAPGLVNNIGLAMIEAMDEVDSVKLYCGFCPRTPNHPSTTC